jgi:hypothetical protein
MPYSELLIKGMREDLTNLGVAETRTPEQVEQAVANTGGTLMIIVNSVCGCAAGKARPGVAKALQHETRPEKSITVFAGAISIPTRPESISANPHHHHLSASCEMASSLRGAPPGRNISPNWRRGELTAAFDKYC